MPDNKHNYEYNYDLGDVIDNAVEMGSKIGSSVLGSIADALEQAGDAMGVRQPDSFSAWKRRLERKWKNGGQSVGVVLTAVGWTFTGCFGITALVLGILTAVGAGPLGLSQQDFIALPILAAVFTPATLGFLFKLRCVHKSEGVCFCRKLIDVVANSRKLTHNIVKSFVGLFSRLISFEKQTDKTRL